MAVGRIILAGRLEENWIKVFICEVITIILILPKIGSIGPVQLKNRLSQIQKLGLGVAIVW